jgi:protein-tyrosine phosphatase
LYLNLVDSQPEIFPVSSLEAFVRFGRRHWKSGSGLLIHCQLGVSRAPSLALLLLAKGLRVFPDDSYDDAWAALSARMRSYAPSLGLQALLRESWDRF